MIAKTLIELMGGAIWLESEPGRGSKFYFTLPLFLETGNAPAPMPVALPERGIGLVLIVDDDAYVRSLIRHALHRRGYGTLEASDCAEAQQKARLHKPDAVSLDMMMPGMDGLRTLRALKADRATAPIPVVAVSVLGDPAHGELSFGTFAFAQKPLAASALPGLIAGWVRPHGEPAQALVICAESSAVRAEFAAAAPALAAHGFRLTPVEAAPDAVAFVITETPGLIVIDTAMPDTDLFELLTALKAEEEAARIPIVLLTDDIASTASPATAEPGPGSALLDTLCEQLSRAIPAWEMPAK